MNRQIKFRAWNKKHKYMENFTNTKNGIEYRDGELCVSSGWDSYDNPTYEYDTSDIYEIMQFTGLTDKNGKEIYEGDVVKWDDESEGKYWRVAEVRLFPSLHFRCFDCPAIENSSAHGHDFHFGNFIYTDTEKYLEVIGNIFENSDLLE